MISVASVFAWRINSCNRERIAIGTWLGGGGGWEWTPFDTRIIYGQFSISIGTILENLTPHFFGTIEPCLIIFPARWGYAKKKNKKKLNYKLNN